MDTQKALTLRVSVATNMAGAWDPTSGLLGFEPRSHDDHGCHRGNQAGVIGADLQALVQGVEGFFHFLLLTQPTGGCNDYENGCRDTRDKAPDAGAIHKCLLHDANAELSLRSSFVDY